MGQDLLTGAPASSRPCGIPSSGEAQSLRLERLAASRGLSARGMMDGTARRANHPCGRPSAWLLCRGRQRTLNHLGRGTKWKACKPGDDRLVVVPESVPSDSHLGLVHIAPAPVLSRLEGLDDRVAACMEVFSRVLVRRGVATANVAACQAQAQMHPGSADSQAILAALGARGDRTDRLEMRIDHCSPHARTARCTSSRRPPRPKYTPFLVRRAMARNFSTPERALARVVPIPQEGASNLLLTEMAERPAAPRRTASPRVDRAACWP